LRNDGRLRVRAGRVLEIGAKGDALTVRLALRAGRRIDLEVDRVINCTGVEEKFADSARSLIRQLVARKLAQVNELGSGFNAGPQGALIDPAGHVSTRLFAIGPMLNGSLLETTAVPEIRAQAETVAKRLLANEAICGQTVKRKRKEA
jgi:uncharacterized NAD(P)/FAD-binding protein YdhS